MKKLMFGAALAATSIAFGASSQPAAQVYDVTLNIKSTAAATATKINNKANPLAVATATDDAIDIIYRKQASYTWKGLIWGCDCESIDGVWEIVDPCDDITVSLETVKGCIIWDTKSKDVVFVGDESTYKYDKEDDALPNVSDVVGKGFGWEFLHCIGKDGKTIEGLWSMVQDSPICVKTEAETRFEFVGAGFGTVSPVVLTSDKYEDPDGKTVQDYSWDCASYIKKISGNFAGKMYEPSITTSSAAGCAYCGGSYGTSCKLAEDVWKWCEDFGGTCGCNVDLFKDEEYTAAYGTWSVCYNSSVSKKLSTQLEAKKIEKTAIYSITQAYNFKNLPKVLTMVELLENEVIEQQGTPVEPSETCQALEDAMNAAKSAWDKAQDMRDEYEEDVNFLSNEKAVNEAYTTAKTAYDTAAATEADAQTAYNNTNREYSASCMAWTNATLLATGSVWQIAYTINANTFTNVVDGCADFDAKIKDLKEDYARIIEPINYYTNRVDYQRGIVGLATNETESVKKSAALVKNVTDAKSTMDTEKELLDETKQDLDDATKATAEKKEVMDAAEIQMNNRTVLLAAAESKLASQEVIVSSKEADYNTKAAAYKAAGCED